MEFEVSNAGDAPELAALVQGVRQHNDEHMGPERSQALSVWARGPDGRLLGGVAGRTIYRQLLIDVLWVEQDGRGRGLGRALMARVEAEARQRGCLAAQVDTLAFQAPHFYERLGFEIVGRVAGVPGSPDRFFLLKRYG